MALSRSRTRLEQKLHSARLSQRDVLRRFPDEAARLGEGDFFVSVILAAALAAVEAGKWGPGKWGRVRPGRRLVL